MIEKLKKFNLKIPKEIYKIKKFDYWKEEKTHGLIHGYMTAFIANIYCPQINQKTILSCLLHDYVKCVYSTEPHDELLKLFFSNLDEETYSHATNPNPKHPLIIADRVELMRFKDYELWLDKSMLDKSFNFNKLKLFYKKRDEIIEIVEKKLKNVI